MYCALADEPLVALPVRQPEDACDVGAHAQMLLDRLNRDAESALTEHLAQTSIADVVVELAQHVDPCPVDYIAKGQHGEGAAATW
ncbi:MAG: hypothetical protein ACR2LS_01710 [Thermomicrobiales bacterium]